MAENVMDPWIPIKTEPDGGGFTVSLWGRQYSICGNTLFSSMLSQGKSLLNGGMRLNGAEAGRPMQWQDTKILLLEKEEARVVLCCSAQSDIFIVNTSITIEYDGCAVVDLKIAPRGRTVPQLFGIAEAKEQDTLLDHLWVDIPLYTEQTSLYHFYPNTAIPSGTGQTAADSYTSGSGRLADTDWALPFKSVVFLGDEERGLSWFSESDEHWQPAVPQRALEIIRGKETTLLRLHLLDGQPAAWKKAETLRGEYVYPPVSFRFGFQATPVKPFPANPYEEHRFHVDCFKKIEGGYYDYFSKPIQDGTQEIGFDRLKRLGVTTLILHEKWNEIQNYWKLTENTSRQLEKILSECHRRGIKVLLYFGYELSTLSDIWHSRSKEMLRGRADDNEGNGWYRVPWQRDYAVCYRSSIQDAFVSGLDSLMKQYAFDGLYLDGTAMVWECKNTLHGCGYTDDQGKVHATFPVLAVRSLMKKLYAVVQSHGGHINCHVSDCLSMPGLSFSHSLWQGEYIQYSLVKNGAETMPSAYLRASHTGRNLGLPIEFIAYESRPKWTFEDAIAFSLVHGILPRPNDIAGPLERMSVIWNILDGFPIAESAWRPYWGEEPLAEASDGRVKISGYSYQGAGQKGRTLFFCTNSSAAALPDVKIHLRSIRPGVSVRLTDAESGRAIPLSGGTAALSFGRFQYFILEGAYG